MTATPTGDDIRRARQARGLSQTELAALAGTNPSTIWRTETGKYADPRKLGAIAHAVGLGEQVTDEELLRRVSAGQLAGEIVRRLYEADELRRGKPED